MYLLARQTASSDTSVCAPLWVEPNFGFGIEHKLAARGSLPRRLCRKQKRHNMHVNSHKADSGFDSRRVLTRDQALSVYDRSVRERFLPHTRFTSHKCSAGTAVQGWLSYQRQQQCIRRCLMSIHVASESCHNLTGFYTRHRPCNSGLTCFS